MKIKSNSFLRRRQETNVSPCFPSSTLPIPVSSQGHLMSSSCKSEDFQPIRIVCGDVFVATVLQREDGSGVELPSSRTNPQRQPWGRHRPLYPLRLSIHLCGLRPCSSCPISHIPYSLSPSPKLLWILNPDLANILLRVVLTSTYLLSRTVLSL